VNFHTVIYKTYLEILYDVLCALQITNTVMSRNVGVMPDNFHKMAIQAVV